MSPDRVDAASFRAAMAKFASGVTVVTTVDASGRPYGFTASAFSSLSLDPPLVLVCLDRGAESFPAFEAAGTFAVSILSAGQEGLAMKFATRGADKFAGSPVAGGPATNAPLVEGALAQLECRVHERFDGGDHVIIVGEVLGATSSDLPPLLHFNRAFGRFVAGG